MLFRSEAGREHAAPIEIARRARDARARRIERDRKAEPEADPRIFILTENANAMLGQIAAADEVVRRHQVERLAADDPHTAQLAAAEQHQAAPVIVGKRRNEPAAARMETAILSPAAARTGVA